MKVQRIPGVYAWVNKENSKPYVGSSVSVRDRMQSHIRSLRRGDHRNRHLQNAWNKYGEEAFEFVVLEYCEIEECIPREDYWIQTFNSADPECGYNICTKAHSGLGIRHSEETKKANSIRSKERWKTCALKKKRETEGYRRSAEERKKTSESLMGHEFAPETLQHKSESATRAWRDPVKRRNMQNAQINAGIEKRERKLRAKKEKDRAGE